LKSIAISLVAIAAGWVLTYGASFSGPLVQKSILDHRLKRLSSQNKPLSKTQQASVQSIVTYALESDLQLDNNLVKTAQSKFSEDQQSWNAYVALLNYQVNRPLIQAGSASPRIEPGDQAALSANMKRLQLMIDAPICGPSNDAISVLSFTNENHRTVKVESLERWPRTIMTCRLPLDGAEIKNTLLEYVVIDYLGGPATLENIRISHVLFDMPKDNLNTRTLAEAVLHTKDDVLNIKLP
jgi:hypothetical protein